MTRIRIAGYSRLLALGVGQLGVSSGPSGAAALAGARAALTEPVRRGALDVDDDAVVVLLSTEGHTR